MKANDLSSVCRVFKVKQRYLTKGEIGVEVEVEGDRLPTEVEGWRVEHDGSLRGGLEYVFNSPKSVEEGMSCLDDLQRAFEESESKIPESVRAGVHVHINVQDMDVVQLMTFISCYLVLEETLVRFCGENRQGNLFCLRAFDAQFLPYALHQAVVNKDMLCLHSDYLRYASVNLKALSEYGSLEFRAMRSTPNIQLIKDWVNILLEVKKSSLTFKDPKEVIMAMSMDGQEQFAARCLGEYFNLLNHEGLAQSVKECARNIQMFAFSTDWEKFKNSFSAPVNPFIEAVDGKVEGKAADGGWAEIIRKNQEVVFGGRRVVRPNPRRVDIAPDIWEGVFNQPPLDKAKVKAAQELNAIAFLKGKPERLDEDF